MKLSNTIVAAFLTVGLATTTATSQTWNDLGDAFKQTVVKRTGSHAQSLGNQWLGADVSATALAQHVVGWNGERGEASFTMSAVGKILRKSAEIGEIRASGLNWFLSPTSRIREAKSNVRILGADLGQTSVAGHSFLRSGVALKLLPTNASAAVAVGPFTVVLSGNCTVSVAANGSLVLPEAMPQVSLSATASMTCYGQASVASSIPGSASLELIGDVANQKLSMNSTVNPRTGFTGGASYSLAAARIKLIVKASWLLLGYRQTLVDYAFTGLTRTMF